MQLLRNEEILYATKRINLEISEISYGFLDPEWNMENLCASFTRVYFPLEGEGILRVGEQSLPLVPDNIYVVPSGLNFSGFCPHALNKIYVHLTLTRPDGSDVFTGIDRILILPDGTERIAQMEKLCRGKALHDILKIKLLLHEILDEALTLCSPKKQELREYSELTKEALA